MFYRIFRKADDKLEFYDISQQEEFIYGKFCGLESQETDRCVLEDHFKVRSVNF